MPGCGGALPELTVASCQNSVCTLFLVVYFLPRFPSSFRSPVRRHCWKEHCWKELLERALLEGAVGRSYWKEPALSRDWRELEMVSIVHRHRIRKDLIKAFAEFGLCQTNAAVEGSSSSHDRSSESSPVECQSSTVESRTARTVQSDKTSVPVTGRVELCSEKNWTFAELQKCRGRRSPDEENLKHQLVVNRKPSDHCVLLSRAWMKVPSTVEDTLKSASGQELLFPNVLQVACKLQCSSSWVTSCCWSPPWHARPWSMLTRHWESSSQTTAARCLRGTWMHCCACMSTRTHNRISKKWWRHTGINIHARRMLLGRPLGAWFSSCWISSSCRSSWSSQWLQIFCKKCKYVYKLPCKFAPADFSEIIPQDSCTPNVATIIKHHNNCVCNTPKDGLRVLHRAKYPEPPRGRTRSLTGSKR